MIDVNLTALLLYPALAGSLLALVTGPLGTFVIWRRMAYFGDTLAHAGLLGLVLGLLSATNPYAMLLLVIALFAVGLVWLEQHPQFSIDTLLGILAPASLSLGLILLSQSTHGWVELNSYLLGDLLAVSRADLYWLAGGAFVILGSLVWRWNALLAMAVNPELAQVEGVAVKNCQLLLMLITALTIALAIKFVGTLLITALLVIPAATARRFAHTPECMALIATGVGLLAVNGGLLCSWIYDTPAAPSIVLIATGLFILALLKGSKR
ncbi:MAG: zinc ABC transporter permease subunit ZnuB [Candidatus Symbiodolus clandestinus]